MKKVKIVLEDGQVFEGKRFGADGDITGELVFTTGMGGYIETLTDPSYYGQIVMQTFPLIGNYGMIEKDIESGQSRVSGYIVREWCENPSNFRMKENIDSFLKSQNIIGVYDVDTRQITKIIREHGVMNAKITDVAPEVLTEIKEYKIKDAVLHVSCKKICEYPVEDAKYNVVLIDYGAKENIIRELNKRGCNVKTVPFDFSAADILKENPDGIMLSNGPGDPSENTVSINIIKQLIGKKPIFGICLGHQLLALASGGKTMKLKYGHRGVNQPVKNLSTGKVYISSQNHGYAVVSEQIEEKGGKISFINVNDNTCEGVAYPDKKAFSVQFHPEASSGPHDTEFLFDEFIKLFSDKQH